MSWGIVIAAGAGLAGAAVSSSASKDAANTQAKSASDASAAQERMFDKQTELQKPWMDTGRQGLNVLSQYLGLTTPQQAQQQAVQQAQVFDAAAYFAANPDLAGDRYYNTVGRAEEHYNDYGKGEGRQAFYTGGGTNPATPAPQVAPVIDPAMFGSLLKEFGAEDFQQDPGYAWRQEQGEKGMQRAASAGGGMGSGKFLKDAMRFNQGLASQEYGAAFDRFNVGKTNTFNRLAAMSGIGQTSANQTGAAAGNFGSQIGSNIIGAGNAMAAGRVGGANALTNGIGQGTSMYQNNQMMNRFFPQGGGMGGAGGYPIAGGFGTGNQYGNQDYGQFI